MLICEMWTCRNKEGTRLLFTMTFSKQNSLVGWTSFSHPEQEKNFSTYSLLNARNTMREQKRHVPNRSVRKDMINHLVSEWPLISNKMREVDWVVVQETGCQYCKIANEVQ